MNTKLFAAVALLSACASMPALSQQQPNAPKASKADVQKVIDSIKADKTKLTNYCAFVKLDEQLEEIASKNKNDPKLQSLGKQEADAIKKVGPDFDKIMNSDLDEASQKLLEDLGSSCK